MEYLIIAALVVVGCFYWEKFFPSSGKDEETMETINANSRDLERSAVELEARIVDSYGEDWRVNPELASVKSKMDEMSEALEDNRKNMSRARESLEDAEIDRKIQKLLNSQRRHVSVLQGRLALERSKGENTSLTEARLLRAESELRELEMKSALRG